MISKKCFEKFEQANIMIKIIRSWYKKIKLNIIYNLLLLFLLLKF